MKQIIYFILALLVTQHSAAQQIIPLQPFGEGSLRGICVVTDSIVWASGSKGTVALSTNGGITWRTLLVKGHEQRDFRDIEAWNENTAIIIAVDTPALILKTTDGGVVWKEVYRNNAPGMFLDAIEFWNELNGMVIGDPINGRFFIARTMNGGESWKSIPEANAPLADEGEALFAASGSNIAQFNQQEAVFVTGGK
ncbi:MAG: WD40/YVTN/BNR-like repeat-containing protein, partial [Chitinophagaceae bacterium]